MEFKKLVLFCSLLAMCVFSAPVDDEEDDIKLTDEQIQDIANENMLESNPPANNDKWPRTPKTRMIQVPFVINARDYPRDALDVFYQGIADIENKTCVRFIKRKAQEDYIYIHDSGKGKCSTKLGKIGGTQGLYLTPTCMRIRKKCVHELLHVLGFHHMHQRFDRDDAVTIQWDNIAEKEKRWFAKWNNTWEAFNTPYDPLSCMHYAKKGFSTNGENTIVPKDPAYLNIIGKQLTLSDGDATRINRLYNCPDPYN